MDVEKVEALRTAIIVAAIDFVDHEVSPEVPGAAHTHVYIGDRAKFLRVAVDTYKLAARDLQKKQRSADVVHSNLVDPALKSLDFTNLVELADLLKQTPYEMQAKCLDSMMWVLRLLYR